MSGERIFVNDRAKSLYSPTTRRSRSKTSIRHPAFSGVSPISINPGPSLAILV
jgi:hypothetical protein